MSVSLSKWQGVRGREAGQPALCYRARSSLFFNSVYVWAVEVATAQAAAVWYVFEFGQAWHKAGAFFFSFFFLVSFSLNEIGKKKMAYTK